MLRALEIVKRSLLDLEGLARQVVSTYKVGHGTEVAIKTNLYSSEVGLSKHLNQGADENELPPGKVTCC